MGVADAAHPRRGNLDCIVAEVRHAKVAEQHAAVGMRIRAHAAGALGRKFGQFRLQAALLIEKFLGPVALQPFFEELEMSGICSRVLDRNLMRTRRRLLPAGHRPSSVPSNP